MFQMRDNVLLYGRFFYIFFCVCCDVVLYVETKYATFFFYWNRNRISFLTIEIEREEYFYPLHGSLLCY